MKRRVRTALSNIFKLWLKQVLYEFLIISRERERCVCDEANTSSEYNIHSVDSNLV